jgi:hypothetical protein
MDKHDLSGPKQWLIELCQEINFGRITFWVRSGEPDLTHPHRTIRTVKLAGGENGPRPEGAIDNFQLRNEHLALLEQMGRIEDDATATIEVKHGLPFLIEVEQDHQAA